MIVGELVKLPKPSASTFWSFYVKADIFGKLTFWRLTISPNNISELRGEGTWPGNSLGWVWSREPSSSPPRLTRDWLSRRCCCPDLQRNISKLWPAPSVSIPGKGRWFCLTILFPRHDFVCVF